MIRRLLTARPVIIVLLILQIVALVAFPPSSFAMTSQEWWLPVLLTFFVVLSIIQIIIRRSSALWPWFLISFSQGLNIISRLIMIMPHATIRQNDTQVFNTSYVALTAGAMILSAFLLWYCELPEVRNKLAQ